MLETSVQRQHQLLPDQPYLTLHCCLQEATTRQKQAALYSATAIHAYFGDVELAQITLRGGALLAPHGCGSSID